MAKKILRKIKRILVMALGSKTDEIYWRFRHIFEKNWAKDYMIGEAINHPHRKFLIYRISCYFPFESALEIGCSSGPNIYLLAKKFTGAKIYGIDISRKAIGEGKKYFKEKKFENIFLNAGGIKWLKNLEDKSIDVVFTDATLIYFDNNMIGNAIEEILRVAKKGVILFELHHNGHGSIYNDNWIHNYRDIIKKFVSEDKIEVIKTPREIWGGNWEENGYLIEVNLK